MFGWALDVWMCNRHTYIFIILVKFLPMLWRPCRDCAHARIYIRYIRGGTAIRAKFKIKETHRYFICTRTEAARIYYYKDLPPESNTSTYKGFWQLDQIQITVCVVLCCIPYKAPVFYSMCSCCPLLRTLRNISWLANGMKRTNQSAEQVDHANVVQSLTRPLSRT